MKLVELILLNSRQNIGTSRIYRYIGLVTVFIQMYCSSFIRNKKEMLTARVKKDAENCRVTPATCKSPSSIKAILFGEWRKKKRIHSCVISMEGFRDNNRHIPHTIPFFYGPQQNRAFPSSTLSMFFLQHSSTYPFNVDDDDVYIGSWLAS